MFYQPNNGHLGGHQNAGHKNEPHFLDELLVLKPNWCMCLFCLCTLCQLHYVIEACRPGTVSGRKSLSRRVYSTSFSMSSGYLRARPIRNPGLWLGQSRTESTRRGRKIDRVYPTLSVSHDIVTFCIFQVRTVTVPRTRMVPKNVYLLQVSSAGII